MTQHVIAMRERMRILEMMQRTAHAFDFRPPPASYPVDLQGMMPLRSAWLLILCLACGARRPGADGIARALDRGVEPKTTRVVTRAGDDGQLVIGVRLQS